MIRAQFAALHHPRRAPTPADQPHHHAVRPPPIPRPRFDLHRSLGRHARSSAWCTANRSAHTARKNREKGAIRYDHVHDQPPSRAAGALLAGAALTLPVGSLAATPVPAPAPKPPSVYTGGVAAVSTTSATLKGSVTPHGLETSYVFQYGPTTTYGAQTSAVPVGNGTAAVQVSQAITGLQPGASYHYRIVATSAAGTTNGADVVFMTKKIPLTFKIASTPNPDVFGSSFSISGVLSGTGSRQPRGRLAGQPVPLPPWLRGHGQPSGDRRRRQLHVSRREPLGKHPVPRRHARHGRRAGRQQPSDHRARRGAREPACTPDRPPWVRAPVWLRQARRDPARGSASSCCGLDSDRSPWQARRSGMQARAHRSSAASCASATRASTAPSCKRIPAASCAGHSGPS